MKIRNQDLEAIAELGYTPEEARFLYIVATHSGYFQPRQFVASIGIAWGKRVQRFVDRLESRGHVTWREYQDMGGVYHLFSKTLYRQINKTDLRNRRRHSTEFIRTRLLLLDFILEHPQHEYFETETDKLAYLCDQRGLPKVSLPAKRYDAASGGRSSLRYFVDKFPMFVDRSAASDSAVVTLSFVDPGQASLAGFAHHLQKYSPLLSQLGSFCFVYIADSTAHFVDAEKCFHALISERFGSQQVEEILSYFGRRQTWDRKRYGDLSDADLESLQLAKQRFASDELERLYAAWSSGELDARRLRLALVRRFSVEKVEFRCCLVSRRNSSRDTNERGDGRQLHPPTSPTASPVTSPPQSPKLAETIGDED